MLCYPICETGAGRDSVPPASCRESATPCFGRGAALVRSNRTVSRREVVSAIGLEDVSSCEEVRGPLSLGPHLGYHHEKGRSEERPFESKTCCGATACFETPPGSRRGGSSTYLFCAVISSQHPETPHRTYLLFPPTPGRLSSHSPQRTRRVPQGVCSRATVPR